MNNKIRTDCFWYRPWKDMSATFHQCHLKGIADECDGMCSKFINKDIADKIMYKVTMSPFKYVAEWQDIGLKFICSHCGFELDGEFPWFEMDLPDYMPAYCPKCGIPMKIEDE